jgi:hypothetical protein
MIFSGVLGSSPCHNRDSADSSAASRCARENPRAEDETSAAVAIADRVSYAAWSHDIEIGNMTALFRIPRHGYSCRTTVRRDLLILIPPLYSMKPSFLNLVMNMFTRERVVPIISASIS